MPYRVLPSGAIECDTAQEAVSLQRLVAHQPPIGNGTTEPHRQQNQPEAREGSIRDRVLAAVADWNTVENIVRKTNLEARQVRGVLLAPGLRERIERRSSTAGKQYRVRQDVGLSGGQ
jgi:hypothetical protein